MVQLLWKNTMEVPQKLNMELYDIAIPLLGLYLKELKAGTQIIVYHVHNCIIHHSQKVEITQTFMDR